MCRRVLYLAAGLAAGFLMIVGHAGATTITTTSFSTWESAAYTTSSSQFELSFTPVGNNSYNTSTGITLTPTGKPAAAFVFTGPDSGSYVLTGTTAYHSLTALEGASDGVGVISVTMPTGGETAMLLGLGGTGSTPPGLTLTLSDGESFSISGGPGLFGFSVSHPITWLTLSTSSGSQPVIDDFYYGTSSLAQDPPPAAEGATAVMIVGGLLIIFGRRRRLAKRREPSNSDDEGSPTPSLDSPYAAVLYRKPFVKEQC